MLDLYVCYIEIVFLERGRIFWFRDLGHALGERSLCVAINSGGGGVYFVLF